MDKKTRGQRRIEEIATSNQARVEYDAATQGLAFTKDFRALDALIQDQMATAGERVYAWIRRRAWGNYRLYCVNDDGKPAFQRDCAKDTCLCKQTISSTIKYLETRGYVRTEGKFLYPVLTPAPQPPEKYKKVSHSPDFLTFLDQWKVSHSTDFQELEVARETVKRLEKVKLSLYKEWVTSRTNALRSLYEREREKEEEAGGRANPEISAQPPVDETPPAGRPEPQPEEPKNTESQPDTDTLKVELAKRKIFTEKGRCEEILAELCKTPVPHFLTVLDDRLKRGQIGPGLLIEIAKKARDTWLPPPKPPDEDMAAKIEAWKWIAENDEDPEARDYAIKKLLEHGVSPVREAAP